MLANPCWVDKGGARVRRETGSTVAKVGLEHGIGFAISDRFLRWCGTEEHADRRAAVRLGDHTLRSPGLPKHRRLGGGRGFDLRRPGGHQYRGYSLPLGTLAAAPLWVATSLHLSSHQDLHASAVQRLPRSVPYPCPRLPEVGRPLRNLVARENDQIKPILPSA